MKFDLAPSEIAVWVVIGLLAGSLAGMVVHRRRDGFGGIVTNLMFGLIGAVVGGLIFDAFDVALGLPRITIDLNKVAAAVVGAVVVVVAAGFLEGQRNKKRD